MVNDLTLQLETKATAKASTINAAVKLFHAAVERATSQDGATHGEFTVAGTNHSLAHILVVPLFNTWFRNPS